MSNGTNPNTTPATTGTDPKTIAIVSYMTWIGWIVAIVLHGNNKSQFGAYHLRQTLLLHILWVGTWILRWFLIFIPFVGWILFWLSWIIFAGLLVLWILGLIAAINGEQKPIPVLGNWAQQMFASIK